jgi:hypothetical protein
MKIYGLDSSWNLQNETVTLNGASDVTTTSQYRRIYRMRVATAGDLGYNKGIITATAATDATVTARIQAQENQSHTSVFTVPSDGTAVICGLYGSMGGTTDANATLRFQFRPTGGAWTTQWALRTRTAAGANSFGEPCDIPQVFLPKTDLRMTAEVNQNNIPVWGGYTVTLPDGFDPGEVI